MIAKTNRFVCFFLTVACATVWGCSSPKYDIDYTIVENDRCPGIELTIKGPAAKIAVLVTTPDNNTQTAIIEKEKMMANSASVVFWQERGLAKGKYIFCVKLFDSEKVAATKDVLLNLEKVEIVNFKFVTEKCPWKEETPSYYIRKIVVTVKKEGNAPVLFLGAALLKIGDQTFFKEDLESISERVLTQGSGEIVIDCRYSPSLAGKLFPGGRTKASIGLVFLPAPNSPVHAFSKEIDIRGTN
ncbi:MAG: hypothetical protein ABFC77_11005 [Thermoguttaceae bacterium]